MLILCTGRIQNRLDKPLTCRHSVDTTPTSIILEEGQSSQLKWGSRACRSYMKLYEVMWGDSLHIAFTKGVDALESKVHMHSSLCGFPAKLLHWPEHHSSCTEEKPSAAPVTGRRLCAGSCRSSPAQCGTGGFCTFLPPCRLS